MKRTLSAAVRLCGCALLVSCGRAQWREADATMHDAARAARAEGFAPMSGPHNTFGAFTEAGTKRWRVHLEAHQQYFIAGACTAGCDSLGFTVIEPHGLLIGADTTTGPTPRLLLTTPEEGDYTITFDYGKCSAPTCRWVAQIYTRRATS